MYRTSILDLLLLLLQLIIPNSRLFEERFSANYSRPTSHDHASNNNDCNKKCNSNIVSMLDR